MNSSNTPETAIQYSLTVDDYIAVQMEKLSTQKEMRTSNNVLFFNCLFLMLGFYQVHALLYGYRPGSYGWLLLGMAVGVGFFGMWWMNRKIIEGWQKAIKELAQPQEERGELRNHTLQIHEEGLVEEASNIRTIYRWNNSFTINSYDGKGGRVDEIAIGNGPVGRIIIPIYGIESGDYQTFLDHLRHVIAEQSLRFKPTTQANDGPLISTPQ